MKASVLQKRQEGKLSVPKKRFQKEAEEERIRGSAQDSEETCSSAVVEKNHWTPSQGPEQTRGKAGLRLALGPTARYSQLGSYHSRKGAPRGTAGKLHGEHGIRRPISDRAGGSDIIPYSHNLGRTTPVLVRRGKRGKR